MSAKDIDIIVSGHLCIDLLPGMSHVSKQGMTAPGALVEVDPLGVSTGGAVSNTGLALHRLGANVRLMANVGDDLLGSLIIEFLKRRDPRLTEQIALIPGQPCSYTVVLSPEGADRTFLHCAGTNSTFGEADIDFALVEKARLFHLGYPPILPRLMADDGVELEAIYRRASATGALTSLDMSLPDPTGYAGRVNWKRLITRTLPHVDVFLPSIEEILFMVRRDDFEKWHGEVIKHLTNEYLSGLADELLSYGPGVVGFKMSQYGLYLKTDGRIMPAAELYQPAFEVRVAGTTGAGDSAYAGFLASLLRGLSPHDALQMAAAVGACCCEAPDATSGVRTWDATRARIADGWALRPERISGFD